METQSQFEQIHKKTYRCICDNEFTEQNIIQLDTVFYCEDCLTKQIAVEKDEVQKLEEKYIFYKEYEASISAGELALLKVKRLTREQQQELLQQEKDLANILKQLKARQQKNNGIIKNLKEKVLQLDKQEIKYWESINKFEKRLYKLEEKANNARWELKTATEEYERLQKFNVLSEVFKITCEGEVGYINGLAIGKKNRQKDIDWEEVNAGIGHLFLLFCFLVIKYEYTCIRLVERQCSGSCSRAKVTDKYYELAYSKQKEKQFGTILDEFLIELEHLKLHVQKNADKEQRIEFPNKIVIGQYKIGNGFVNPGRIKQSKWDNWTISMKYLLTNFQYLATVYSLSDKYV